MTTFYTNFGKRVKDLFSKQYDYKNQLTVKSAVDPDLTVESTATMKEGNVSGLVKASQKFKDFGSVELEVGTAGAALATVKATNLAKGLVITLEGKDTPLSKILAEYKQDRAAVTASVEGTMATIAQPKVQTSCAMSFDKITVGGLAGFDVQKQETSAYDVGVEYQIPGSHLLTLKCLDKLKKLEASYALTYPTAKTPTTVGGQFECSIDSKVLEKKGLLTFGVEHDVNAGTKVKAKVDTNGLVAGVVEHKLANPLAKVQLSGQYGLGSKAFEKYGVGLTFGDI